MTSVPRFFHTLLCLVLVALATDLAPAATSAGPNVIIIFIDDMGYADIGPFGAADLRTPNLDRMAREGMRFTSFYAAPVCSMSRAALMTGCYNARVSMPGCLFPEDKIGLNPDEVTVAEVLKARGYATGIVGKWHLGHLPPFLPTKQGFDEYFGTPYSHDMGVDNGKGKWPRLPLIRGEKVIETEPDIAQITRRYADEAVRFIEDHHATPFFLYLPHNMVHTPHAASDGFKGKSKRGLYGDAVEEVDGSVGKILDTLDRLKIADNTLVIFTSDNGPGVYVPEASAYPLRGRKGCNYEGGLREPCIMRWPGQIPASTTCDRITGTIDLLPTLAKISGGAAPDDRVIDGVDISPLMRDPRSTAGREVHLYYTPNMKIEGIRVGDWKLLPSHPKERLTKKEKEAEDARGAPSGPELYNLATDIGETTNVAAEHPDIVRKLLAEAKRRDAELQAHKRPIGKAD